ncbi:tetratricopeptide repeat protein [Phenylobacterium sp.]|jgi:tetratricopeptide (TPR) repeat protein|uniref:tetratricopeptide repeat protein n=1 Tax=Phenylobacterium sp. TaxID=1871053 RepID=UPI002E371E52|nr:tetratricopeptide repeat protein [Phenylobacterium sp.]HEX3366599.1 tetratricopeptide repeat protein [Phenylobacterium sp.]
MLSAKPEAGDVQSPAADAAGLMREAMTEHAAGRIAEAEASYRAVLARWPDHHEALGMLALILADGEDAEAAEAMAYRHLALRPTDATALLGLGRLWARQGDDEAAVPLFRRAARRAPAFAPIRNELGVSLHRLGRREEALAAFDEALQLDPTFQVARGNRGLVLGDLGRSGEAMDELLIALADPNPALRAAVAVLLGALSKAAARVGRLPEAEAAARAHIAAGHDGVDAIEELAVILDRSKRPDEAQEIRNGLARRFGVQRRNAGVAPLETVVVLCAVGAGHVPTRYLVDPDCFTTLTLALLSQDQAEAPLGAIDPATLAEATVIFSTLGDADRDDGQQLAAAAAFCERLGKPVLNPPHAIARTARANASALFAGVPGLVTPPVRALRPADLAALPIENPVLIRPAGDHGGENLVRLTSEAEKQAYLASGPSERLLLAPFHDFRSADGFWRKYRMIFVDRRPYPFHLAIGEDWLLHYWRADMAKSAWKLAEEERFLADWRGVFGPRAAAAADEIGRRLDLDYAGMDCALSAVGDLLLFEANACILIHLDETAEASPAKHRYVPPIRDAFTRMLRARAASLDTARSGD